MVRACCLAFLLQFCAATAAEASSPCVEDLEKISRDSRAFRALFDLSAIETSAGEIDFLFKVPPKLDGHVLSSVEVYGANKGRDVYLFYPHARNEQDRRIVYFSLAKELALFGRVQFNFGDAGCGPTLRYQLSEVSSRFKDL